jgi:hypothetical protein
MLNFGDDGKTFWYFDESGMILERLGWGENGVGDAIGRNAFAYICHPNESRLKEYILRCVKIRDDSYVQCYRYPDRGASTMSRDHVGAIILSFYINRDWDELDLILQNLPWRLSRKHTQTIDFWLWQKTLLHRKDRFKHWILSSSFLILTLIQFILIVPWNRLIRCLIGAKNIDPADHNYVKPPKWKYRLYWMMYPQFALFLLAWQLKVMPDSLLKWIVQALASIESGNIVIDRLLNYGNIDRSQYRPTTSFIWSRRLDNFDDIMIRPMTSYEAKWNDLNQSMIDYLYFGIDRIMLEYPDEIVRSIKENKRIINY